MRTVVCISESPNFVVGTWLGNPASKNGDEAGGVMGEKSEGVSAGDMVKDGVSNVTVDSRLAIS